MCFKIISRLILNKTIMKSHFGNGQLVTGTFLQESMYWMPWCYMEVGSLGYLVTNLVTNFVKNLVIHKIW